MPQLTLLIGGLLTLLGVGGYLLGFAFGSTYASWTALIPAFAGVPILICGLIASASESARKHAMHAAVAIALLGAISTIPPMITRIFNPEVQTTWLAKVSVFGMLVLCVWLVVAGVSSFVRARRERGFDVGTRGA